MNTPVRVGGEFLVNTTTFGDQADATITALSDGRFVVVWRDGSETGGDTDSAAIRAQIFSATGDKLGAEFLVNSTTGGIQDFPEITALSDGGFVILWTDYSHTRGELTGLDVRAQVFSTTGNRLGGEFVVNTTTLSHQSDPAITALADGRFVVAWSDTSGGGADTSGSAIRAQIISATGERLGAEFLVNSTTSELQTDPAIVALSNGGFVVAWDDFSRSGGDQSSWAVRGQIFNAHGAKLGDEFLINGTTIGPQYQPALTALPNGRFVAVWEDASNTGGDTSGSAIRGQVFEASGARIGPEFLVNTFTYGSQWEPDIAALSNDRFVVVWTGSDSSGSGIRAQVFGAGGEKVGTEFLINSTELNQQTQPSVTSLSDGRFVVSWSDISQTGDDTSFSAIRAQIFDAGGVVNTPPDVVGAPQPDQIAQGAAVSLDLAPFFADADGDALVFAATGLPPGLQIDAATGLISGTVPFIVNNGTFAVQVEVSDGRGGTATVSFDWAVYNDTPPYSAVEIFAEHGKLGFLATMAKAAYHLRADESGAARYNTRADGADAAYATVAGDLALLHDGDRPEYRRALGQPHRRPRCRGWAVHQPQRGGAGRAGRRRPVHRLSRHQQHGQSDRKW